MKQFVAFEPNAVGPLSLIFSAKTLLNEVGLLQSIFSLAVENDLLDRSPVRSKHKPKVVRSEKPIWTS